jgi:esterase/lipase
MRDLANRVLRRFLVVAAAIGGGYVAVGAWLAAGAGGDASRAGAGWGIAVQGAILVVFALVHRQWMPPPGPLLPPGLAPFRGPGHEAFSLRREERPVGNGSVGGALLIHGFAGSPREMRTLAAVLAADGWLVEVPRLPGHGADIRDIAEYRVEDWVAAVEDAAASLREAGIDHLLVVGRSVGGSLALVTAARIRPDAVVLLAPFAWHVPAWQRWLMPVARVGMPSGLRLFGRLDTRDPPTQATIASLAPGADLDDPAVVAGIRDLRVPLSLLEELFRVSDLARRAAPRVRVPVLAIQGLSDTLSRPGRTRALLAVLPVEPSLLEVPVGHDLVSETSPVRDQVLARIRAFAAQRS